MSKEPIKSRFISAEEAEARTRRLWVVVCLVLVVAAALYAISEYGLR